MSSQLVDPESPLEQRADFTLALEHEQTQLSAFGQEPVTESTRGLVHSLQGSVCIVAPRGR